MYQKIKTFILPRTYRQGFKYFSFSAGLLLSCAGIAPHIKDNAVLLAMMYPVAAAALALTATYSIYTFILARRDFNQSTTMNSDLLDDQSIWRGVDFSDLPVSEKNGRNDVMVTVMAIFLLVSSTVMLALSPALVDAIVNNDIKFITIFIVLCLVLVAPGAVYLFVHRAKIKRMFHLKNALFEFTKRNAFIYESRDMNPMRLKKPSEQNEAYVYFSLTGSFMGAKFTIASQQDPDTAALMDRVCVISLDVVLDSTASVDMQEYQNLVRNVTIRPGQVEIVCDGGVPGDRLLMLTLFKLMSVYIDNAKQSASRVD